MSIYTTTLTRVGCESVVAKIKLKGEALTIASVYIPPEGAANLGGILENLGELPQGSQRICGDLDAHHPDCGSSKTSKAAKALAAEIGTGSPTFWRPLNATSVVDFTLHSPDIALTWFTDEDA